MLTVKDALTLDVFKGATLVAGAKKINNIIAAVTVLEVTSDDIAMWTKDDELWITSFYSIAEDVDRQIHIMKLLHEKNASGIVICGLGYFFPEISPRLIRAADEIGMPLIVMPPESAYEEVINALMSILLNSHKEELMQALQVQRALNTMVLRNRNLPNLLQFLESALKKDIAFIDNENRLVYPAERKKAVTIKERIALPQSLLHATAGAEDLLLYKDGCVYYALQSFGCYYGTLVVFRVEKTQVEHVRLMLSNAVASIMLVNTSKTSLVCNKEPAFQQFFHMLECRELIDAPAILEHAEHIDLNLYNKHFIAVITAAEHPERVLHEVQRVTAQNHRSHELAFFDCRVVLLCDCDTQEDGRRCIETLCREIGNALAGKEPVTIGVSRYCEVLAEIGTAYRQALQAVEIGSRIFPDESCFFYEQLGVYPLICDHYRQSCEGRRVKENLDILEKHDKKYGSMYLQTLKDLFLFPGSLESIAAKLYIHKNTLLYRKNKIIELLEHDPFLMPYQLDYQIYFIAERLKPASSTACEDV